MTQERPQRETPVRRTVPVRRIEDISAHIRRITFGGPEFAGFSVGGPAEHMKIYFPPPGSDAPIVPDFGQPPVEGQPRSVGRTYTPRKWHPDTMEFDVDFVLHGEGPGSNWATEAKPGKLVTISTPKSAYNIDPAASRYVIAGDLAAIPAIGTILETLPASARADVYIELDDAGDQQKLATDADIQLTWLSADDEMRPSARIVDLMRRVALPEDVRVFVACEAQAMREVRKLLLHERGMTKEQIYTHGYWKVGAINHPDGDRGLDVE